MPQRFYKVLLLTLALFWVSTLQAQTVVEAADVLEGQPKVTLQQMPVQASALPASEDAIQLVTSSSTILSNAPPLPVGVCTVISGFLTGFCQNNPGDISCSFQ